MSSISISSGTIVRAILFVILFATLFYIKDLVLVVLAAVVIASSVEPVPKWFSRFKIKRLPAVIITYLGLFLVLAGFFFFFVPTVLNETYSYLNALPDNIKISDILISPSSSFADKSFPIKEFLGDFSSLVSGGSEGAFKTFSVFFGGALSFILMIVLSFYLVAQEDGVGNFLRIITPIKHQDYIIDLWKRSQAKMGFWMQGQLLLGLIVGLLVYLGLMILGVKHALLLAVIAALFELIPVFGPILSAIPAVATAAASGGVSLAVLVLGLYIIIHQFENHLFYPLVVKKIVGISPIIVILALVVGLKLAGILGALLAVPLAAALMEYVNDVEKAKRTV